MEKLDLTRLYKNYYSAKPTPAIVDIEEAKFLSVTGKGDPSEKMFADKIEALYTTAYAIKFISKSSGKDFVVARLEGLWWFDEQKFAGLHHEIYLSDFRKTAPDKLKTILREPVK